MKRHRTVRPSRRELIVTIATVLAMVLSFVPALIPGAKTPEASAHNLNASAVYVFFDPDTQAWLDAKIALGNAPGGRPVGQPLLRAGDELGMIIKAVPDLGTQTGVGGYTTFYVPNGLQVEDAAYIMPGDLFSDGITGWDKVPMKGQARMPIVGAGGDPTVSLVGITRGPNILGVTSPVVTAANTNLGTVVGVYGDTGIFYSTAPETAFGSYTGPAQSITNNSGDIVGLRTILQKPLNAYDAWQMAAFGIKATTNPSYPAAALVDSNQRGYAPWGMANVVAGPQSGYAWSFNKPIYDACDPTPTITPDANCINQATQAMGPWQRIKYAGSQISDDPPGGSPNPPYVQPYTRGADASNVGFSLSPATPLTATTFQTDTLSPKAVRWAFGQLTYYQPEYVWIKVKVIDNQAILDATGCPKWTVDTFGGDAGGDSGGKDHIWRYYDPNSVTLNGCLAIGKPATRELVKVGDSYQYKVKLYNAGNNDFSTVQIQDTLPAGATFVSAVPAPSNISLPNLTWTVAPFLRSQMFEATVTVKATSSGLINNSVCASGITTGNQTINSCGQDITVSGNQPLLRQSKDVTPTSVAPGGNVQYTLTMLNVGSGATANPVLVTDYLPAGFTYASKDSVIVNGADVTAGTTVNTANPNQPIFTVPSPINASASLVLKFTAHVAATQTGGAYCNTYMSTQNGINVSTGSLACVQVGGASIGDTVYRDWNGNNAQDPGEEGIPGIQVCVTPGNICATTDANGKYLINGLTAGAKTVTVSTPPAGSTPTQGNPSYSITLATNETNLTADFGYQPGGNGSIGDTVWGDTNGDGVINGSETGIANVTVNLYEDTNGNGVINAGSDLLIATDVTDGSGVYGFSGLDPTLSYIVKVDETDTDLISYFNPDSFVSTTGNPQTVSPADFAAQSNNVTDADFGYKANLPSSIGDTVCIDSNLNGVCDPGEPGIPNITVNLYRDLNNDGIGSPSELVTTTVSGPTGTYLFSGLGPDNYIVVVDSSDPDLPAGVAPAVAQYRVPLPANTSYLTADFPFVRQVTKTVDKSYADPGGTLAARTLTFTLKPYYPGGVLLSNVRVIDPLPTGTTYIAASANAGGVYGPYTPLAAVAGSDPDGGPAGGVQLDTTMTVNTNFVNVGGTVSQVRLNVKSSTAINNVSPVDFDFSGGSATCTGPAPASANVPAGGSGVNFDWSCTLDSAGEFVFSAGAEDNATGGADYSWPAAASASVLSAPDGGPNVVTWSLGSNTAGVPGATLVSGSPAAIFAFRGANTKEFSKYSISNNAWTAKAQPANGIEKGGSLTSDGAGTLYALEGNSKVFYKYTIASDTWSPASGGGSLAQISANANEGGSVQYLNVSGTEYVFALLGGGNKFARYSVSGNSWTAMVTTPSNVKKGGSLTTDGTYLYALRGDRQKSFWRCNATTNDVAGACSGASGSWTALANTPGNVGWGGALVRLGNYVYATQGDGKTGFWRCNFTTTGSAGSCDTSWSTLAVTLGAVADGGRLTTDGVYVYALQGKSKTFWRYDPAANAWASPSPAAVNFTGSVGQGGALAFTPAVTPVGRYSSASAAPTLVSSGNTVKVVFTFTADQAANNVTPTSLTPTATGSASAACGAATLKSADDDITDITDPVVYEWTCTVTPGSSPGTLKWSASATTSPATTPVFPTATTRTVLVSPVLSFQASVNASGAPAVIKDTGLLVETGGTFDAQLSNTTQTATAGSIGDFVWADLNGNGAQDTGEPGIAGVKVFVDSNTNGSWDTGEPYAVTDGSGLYRIYGLTAATYSVRTDPATYPAGYYPTTTIPLSVVLASGQQYNNADFGLQPPGTATIGDTVWWDANNNGSLDGSESGLPNVTVKLYRDSDNSGTINAGDVLLQTTTTDASGNYLFSGLNPGNFLVQVDESSTVTSPYDASVTTTIAAGMTATTGTTNPRDVAITTAGQAITDADFGYNWKGVIGDTVWYDNNRDQVVDGFEPRIPGAQVFLYYDSNHNGVLDPTEYTPVLAMKTTDPNGLYFMNGLPPGYYLVDVYEDSFTVNGNRDAVPTTPDVRAINLPAGQQVLTADFGYYKGALVEGHVFWDANRDGVIDPGETGLTPVTVNLTGQDSFGSPVSLSTASGAGGYFSFLVPEGTYTITYSQPDVLAINPALGDTTTPTSYTVSPLAGPDWHVNLLFGVDNTGKVGDLVWNDANGNGVKDPSEVGIGGVTVNLLASNGATLLATTSTNPQGGYLFPGLPDGTYIVAVDTNTLPPDMGPTGDPDENNTCTACDNRGEATVTGGGSDLTLDFGYQGSGVGGQSDYTLSGRVYNDQDNSSTDNGGTEPGFNNVTVTAVCVSGTFITQTDNTGYWAIAGIPNGSTCTVLSADKTDLPRTDYVATEIPGTPITVNSSQGNLNFGFHQTPGSIAGTVCNGDTNGVCDGGELPLQNATVTLYYAPTLSDPFTQVGSPVTTGPSGAYSFTNLEPGYYQVVETNPPGYSSLSDADGGNPDNISVQLAIGQNKTAQDFEDTRPVIGAAKSVASVTSNGGGVFTVVYDLVVKNYGTVALTNVQVTDSLASAFPGASLSGVSASILSGTLTANAGYNGNGNTNLLAGTDTLAAGASGMIRVTVTVTNASTLTTYNNQATATGGGPNNTTATDLSDNGANPDPNGNGDPTEVGENDPTPVKFSEAPAIGIAKALGSVKDNLNGTYTVVYNLVVQNLGNVTLSNVQVTDDLSLTFAGATSFSGAVVTSSDFTVNGSYNGSTNTNLLAAAGNSLAVGQTKTLQLTVTVTPGAKTGPYNNQAIATGVSPAGTTVSDLSDNGLNPDPNGNNNANEPGENDPTPVDFSNPPAAIGVAKRVVSNTNNNDGTYTVVLGFVVKNVGATTVSSVQVVDDLSSTFAGASSFAVQGAVSTTGGLTANGSYDGASNVNLLSGTNSLTAGASGTIQFTVKVTPGANPGPYLNVALVSGVGPGGAVVGDISDNGTAPDPNNNGNPSEPGENDPTPITFDNPVIGVAKSVAAVTNNGNGSYTVVYSLLVKNLGNVALSNVQVSDNLLATFAGAQVITVVSVTSPTFTTNPGYTGTGNNNLLASGQSLAVGGSGTILITVTVTPDPEFMGPFYNQATATGTSPGGVTTTDKSDNGVDPDPNHNGNPGEPGEDDPTPIDLTERPAIGVAKSVGAVTNHGSGSYTVVYNLVVENLGDVNLSNVQVTDSLAATFSGATSIIVNSVTSSGFTVNPGYNGGTNANLLAAGNTLAVGAVKTIQVTVTVTTAAPGPYNNQATATGVSPAGTAVSDLSDNGINPDPNGNQNANEPGENDPTPVRLDESPAIGAAKTLVSSTNNGSGTYTVVYDVLVKNIGTVTLSNVQVTDDLAATFAGATSFSGASVSLQSGSVTVNAGYNGSSNINLLSGSNSLAVGASATVRITVQVTPGSKVGPYDNQAAATGTSPLGTTVADLSDDSANLIPDPNNNGNATEPGENDPTPITFGENPAIGVAKAVASVTNLGGGAYKVVYDLVVQNIGDVNLSNVQVTDDLAAAFSPATISSASATSSGFTVNGGYNGSGDINLLAASQTLNVGQTKTIQVTVTVSNVNTTTTYDNQATASGVSPANKTVQDLSDNGVVPDPNHNGNAGDPGEDDPTPIKFAERPAIGAAKAVAAVINNGDGTYTLTYNLVVQNLGDVPLSSVQVIDDLRATFPLPVVLSGVSATSSAFTVNGSYDGVSDTNLLAAGNTLAVGETKALQVTVTVGDASTATIYTNQALAVGTSPAGTVVSDPSDSGINPDPNGNGNANEPGENDPTPVKLSESPALGIAKNLVSNTNNGDGSFNVVFDLLVTNLGNVSLSNVQVVDDLATTFAGATSFSVVSVVNQVGAFTLNGGYNGGSDINLLTAGNTMNLGVSRTIRLTVKVTPGGNGGPYTNQALATGTSPAGTVVGDLSDNGTNPDPNGNGNPSEQGENDPTPVTFSINASIGDLVWWDADGSGTVNGGESGIDNVTLDLYTGACPGIGAPLATATTSGGGVYIFNNLSPNTYCVAIDPAEFQAGGTLANWTPTVPNPAQMTVVLGAGQTNTTTDFGVTIESSYQVTKKLNTPDPVRPGEPISFTIRITNTGDTWITTLPLEDTYNNTFLTYGFGGNFAVPDSTDHVNDGVINWSDLTTALGDLAPNGGTATVTVWFTAREDTTTLPNGAALNTATVKSAVADPDGAQGPLPPEPPLPTQSGEAGVRIQRPTGLGVYGFSATPVGMDVVVRWKTASESSIAGFVVLRSENGGDYAALNQDLIAAQSAGSNTGNAYEFVDRMAPGSTPVAYKVEVMTADGRNEEVGPAYLELQRLRAFAPLYLHDR